MTDVPLLTPKDALRVIAEAPGGAGKTVAELREAAADCERRAHRKDRVAVRREESGRRKARTRRADKDADRLTAYAALVSAAADELEKRKALTVEEALRAAPVRLWLRLRRKFSGGEA